MPISFTVTTNAERAARRMGVVAREVPFTTALALTATAKSARERLRTEAGRRLTLRNTWTAKGFQVRSASKHMLVAAVGSRDWYMAEQAGDRPAIRKPHRARYLWIPMKARSSKRQRITPARRPGRLLARPNVILRPVRPGRLALYRRRRDKLELLYVGVRRQRVRPAMSWRATVARTARAELPRHMARALAKAQRTAKRSR